MHLGPHAFRVSVADGTAIRGGHLWWDKVYTRDVPSTQTQQAARPGGDWL